MLYPCGQCVPCRINRKRLWTHRILLETKCHPYSAFVTLTYDDENLPHGGTLDPDHARDWLKRFRKAVEPQRVRYYLVGEYGEKSGRPHYHAAIFGYAGCYHGRTRRLESCCPTCEVVRKSWGMGRVDVGIVESASAQYLAGYTVKKMTRHDDPRLEGKHPEFARMSLKPGIGLGMMDELASTCIQYNLVRVDVPYSVRHGPVEMPLGRYLRQQLRLRVGREANAPQEAIEEHQQKLWELSCVGEADAAVNRYGQKTFAAKVLAATKGVRAGIEARARIKKQRRAI